MMNVRRREWWNTPLFSSYHDCFNQIAFKWIKAHYHLSLYYSFHIYFYLLFFTSHAFSSPPFLSFVSLPLFSTCYLIAVLSYVFYLHLKVAGRITENYYLISHSVHAAACCCCCCCWCSWSRCSPLLLCGFMHFLMSCELKKKTNHLFKWGFEEPTCFISRTQLIVAS